MKRPRASSSKLPHLLGALLTALVLHAAALAHPLFAQGAQEPRPVIPAGQESLIGRMLSVDPHQSGGWWFSSASVEYDEIVATFEKLGARDPRMLVSPEAAEETEPQVLETLHLRLVHPSAAPSSAPKSSHLAVLLAGENDEAPPADLMEVLLPQIRREEDGFVWAEARGRAGADPGHAANSGVLSRWALSAGLVALTLGLLAAGRGLARARRRRRSGE